MASVNKGIVDRLQVINAISAGTNVATSGTVNFLNSNGVTFGMDTAGNVTASAVGGGGGGTVTLSGNNTAGNTSVAVSIFSGGNNITLSGTGSTLVISGANIPTQTNQSIGFYAVGNTTQNSSTTLDARTLSINGLGIVTAGFSNGSIDISATQSAQSIGLYGLGNTTQNSSTTLDARTLSFNGLGIITVGYSNGSIQLSATTAQSVQSEGWYALGNTTQNSSTTLDARTHSINGAGIVTVGYSNGTIQISATTPSQTNQTAGFYAVGNTTQNSSTTLDARTLSINGLGIITAGFSNGSIDISATQSAQSVGLYALGNTTQNSSTTLDARTLSFNGLGAQTVGYSNGSIQLSVPVTSSLVGTNGISISTNGSTISVSYLGNTAGSMLSYYEPAMRGGTSTNTMANGTLYVQPFVVSTCVSAYQAMLLQHVSTQPTTTASFLLDVSSQTASSGTGKWVQSGTILLFSRQSTGTAAASSNLISCGSNSYSFGMGHSASVTWSTNVLSATASITTSGAASFISNIDSAGGSTTGSFGTSGSMTFSTGAAVSGTYSSSFAMSFASQCFSGVRPIFVPLGTSLTPGEYWLGHIISTGSSSSTLSLQQVCQIPGGLVGYTSNTSAYAEIGSTATIAGSNIPVGWGSYSSSGNTTTTFAMSNISNMSNNQTWFALAAWTK